MRINQAVETPGYGNLVVHLKNTASLSKVHLSVFIAFSAYFGCYLCNPSPGMNSWLLALSVFFLSCGCSTLNNIQDREVDGQFERTRCRPLPQNRVTLKYAFIQSILMIVVPIVLLLVCFNTPLPGILGIMSVLLYNGCYTPLKRKTQLAMVPGVICGMLPPLIGWTAYGWTKLTMDIITVLVIFGLWQIPHTWMVILRYFPDSREASLPGFSDIIAMNSLRRILFVWVLSLSVSMIYFAAGMAVMTDITRWFVVLNSICMAWAFAFAMILKKEPHYGRLFLHLNLSLMTLMVLVVVERIILFR